MWIKLKNGVVINLEKVRAIEQLDQCVWYLFDTIDMMEQFDTPKAAENRYSDIKNILGIYEHTIQ